jgi:hypothetical protein
MERRGAAIMAPQLLLAALVSGYFLLLGVRAVGSC